MPLDPLLQQFMAAAAAAAPGSAPSAEPEEIKQRRAAAAAADQAVWASQGVQTPEVPISVVTVEVEGAPDVNIRVHHPRLPHVPLPAIITFFGGAFRQGSNDFDSNRWIHASRAQDADVVVIAVDYALAPEHPFPAQQHQGVAVLNWVVAHAQELGVDPARLALGGQSSGGNLAAAVAQRNALGAAHPLALQLLEVPVLDLSGGHTNLTVLGELGLPDELFEAEVASLARLYLPEGTDPRDPAVSPLFREDLTGLPRTFILAAEYDPLRGDARAYLNRLRQAGVDAAGAIMLGQDHGSGGLVGALEGARAWHRTVVGALRELHQ
ncbi:alpha/beta hydrolase [Galactobacter caseinivorans]|uniref:Alpha/beta hydrolase n=1 Tax=Galactobacter caseinivorans TaxID=2676123 RepID=A0A496PM88_9MICC|nr:alpha/beta hydrolase [Galactobacter caseinivorans]RKW71554.1 alpha/beta hydrolase [Galactobacter caseinivorans]